MVWAIFTEPQFKAIEEVRSFQSERVLAIIGGTLLDEALRRTLEERLRESGVRASLFRIEGPLGNVGPKIDLAYLLYAIEKETREAAHGIAGVRNFFAHNLGASFSSQDEKFLERAKKAQAPRGADALPVSSGGAGYGARAAFDQDER
jgi:hypothetical protein